MHIRAALPADADAIDRLFREFVAYLRTVGDHNEYRFGAQQYLEDGFGRDPAFRGLVAEDQARVIGYLLFSKGYDVRTTVARFDFTSGLARNTPTTRIRCISICRAGL
jgi:hypothetical protein